jgi:hypothetical protein
MQTAKTAAKIVPPNQSNEVNQSKEESPNFRPNPLLDYGKWCGPQNTQPDQSTPPDDTLDAACKKHDLCYYNSFNHNCPCDRDMLINLDSVRAKNEHAEAYKVAAIAWFNIAPCSCSRLRCGKVCLPRALGGGCAEKCVRYTGSGFGAKCL